MGKIGGIFLTAKSANKRTYAAVYSSNVKSRIVPRKCALVKSGPKKGKLRKGCYFRGHNAFCDVLIADKMSCDVKAAKKAVRKTTAKKVRHTRPPVLHKRHRSMSSKERRAFETAQRARHKALPKMSSKERRAFAHRARARAGR